MLAGGMTIGEALGFFSGPAQHRSYPVVDADGWLLGLVSRSDALRWQVEGEDPRLTLEEVLSDVLDAIRMAPHPIGAVADLMVVSGTGRIPIVARETHRVVGILSRHDLLKARAEANRTELQRSGLVSRWPLPSVRCGLVDPRTPRGREPISAFPRYRSW